MIIQRLGILAFTAIIVLAGQQFATAQSTDGPDPEQIARRCVASVDQIAERCVSANVDTAHECIRRIHELLEAGNTERARAVAHRCLNVIEARSDACVDEIHERCRHCIEILLRLDSPGLARRVREACLDAVERVRHSQRRTSNAIRGQFDGE